MVIACVVIRYRKKHNPSSGAALSLTGVPNNAATIAAAKKEKELDEGTYDNPTYRALLENDYSIPPEYENNLLPTDPQDYEVPYDTVQY